MLPATAQSAPDLESYSAGAKATALDLTLFGQQITVSETTAGIDSTPKAVADGKSLVSPLFSSDGAPVSSTGAAQTGTDCQNIALPSPLNVASIDLVCVNTKAEVANQDPSSSSASNEVVIEVRAGDIISTTPLGDAIGQIQDGLGSILDALAPVTDQLKAQKIDLQATVNGLLDQIQAGDVIARITIAPTSSTTKVTADGVAANASSNGVVVEILPNLPGGALAVATVGASTAGVVRDVSTGAATTSGDAAVLSVTYPNGLVGGLAQLTDAVGDALSTTVDQLACGAANPLSDVLCFTLGASTDLDAAAAKAIGFDFGPTTAGRETSVLSLRLLGVAQGGIVLNIGHTAAAAAAVAAVAAPPPLPGAPAEPVLPHTGGDSTLPLTLALFAVGIAGAFLLRRTRSA
jgi:LPXTG-motif cell wall-anchored protein